MSESEAKEIEKTNSNAMPMDLQAQSEEEPTEVILAMLYTAAKILESRALAQVLTGHSPISKKIVTYIRLPMVEVDNISGFRMVESIGSEELPLDKPLAT